MLHERYLLALLVLLPLALTEECKTCFELSTDNIFLQTLFTNLLDTQIKCSQPVTQECSGQKPNCVSAMFSVSDQALGAKFKVKIAQCSVRSIWESLLYRSSLGNAVGDMDVRGAVDVNVWDDGNATDHEEKDLSGNGQRNKIRFHVDL